MITEIKIGEPNMKTENELLDQIKRELPNLNIGYGQLQSAVETVYLSENMRFDINTPELKREYREKLMNDLGEIIIENKSLFDSCDNLNDVLFNLSIENLKQNTEFKNITLSTYEGEKKNNGVTLPILTLQDETGKEIELKVSSHTERDKEKDYGDIDVIQIRLKGLKVSVDGRETKIDKLDGVVKKLATILDEGSFGDTGSVEKFNPDVDSREDRERIRDEKNELSTKATMAAFENALFASTFRVKDLENKQTFVDKKDPENQSLSIDKSNKARKIQP